MQKGPVHTTKKWHDKHAQRLRQIRLKKRNRKIDRKGQNSMKAAERRYQKAMRKINENWKTLKWYQRLWIKIKYWFKKK